MNDEVQAVTEVTEAATTAVVNANKSGMSTGCKVGIIGGAIALVGAGVAGTVLFLKKRKAKKAKVVDAKSTKETKNN